MSEFLYKFPEAARFGSVVPKSKIYAHAKPSNRVKRLFVEQIDKIEWTYKLSSATVNIPATKAVQEIQVFTIKLKSEALDHEVLHAIDKAIPSPILFVLVHENQVRYAATYKRPSEADASKWVVGGYFETDWLSDDAERMELPVVLDLGKLYRWLLHQIIPLSPRENETLDALVARFERLRVKEREADRLEARLQKEKQFNRKVEINAALRNLNQDIAKLKH